MLPELGKDTEGDQITGMGGIGSTRTGQATAIQTASHIPTTTTHHHHLGGTEVAWVVPGNRGLEVVITGMIVNVTWDTVGDTMEDIEDIKDSKVVSDVHFFLKYDRFARKFSGCKVNGSF